MESSKGETVTGEAEQTEKYVIYRTIFGDLDYAQQEAWDRHKAQRGERLTMLEVSRGHTRVEAVNLTKLGNEEG
jgi:hypothetical protein